MPYNYDAFFSYKRDRESNQWHERVKDKLEFWLKQELGRLNVKVFLDVEEIHTGMRWRNKLTDALKSSKCILCLWSPLYFQSKWCVSEWMTFEERERLSNRELIVPASYFDGKSFPARATATQLTDFSEFASTMPRFWDTDCAVRFEAERLRPFARDLARVINSAPPFTDAFPIIEAPDEDVQSEQFIARIGAS